MFFAWPLHRRSQFTFPPENDSNQSGSDIDEEQEVTTTEGNPTPVHEKSKWINSSVGVCNRGTVNMYANFWTPLKSVLGKHKKQKVFVLQKWKQHCCNLRNTSKKPISTVRNNSVEMCDEIEEDKPWNEYFWYTRKFVAF